MKRGMVNYELRIVNDGERKEMLSPAALKAQPESKLAQDGDRQPERLSRASKYAEEYR